MARVKLDMRGLDRLIAHLDKIQNINPRPLLDSTMLVMFDDNRKGILKGTDRHGGYMLATTYRPEGKGKRANARQKNNQKGRRTQGEFFGFGPHAAGLHNNLTTAEYRKLNGPPLAPRRQYSRVITNYKLRPYIVDRFRFGVEGRWEDVVDVKGRPFLHYHFQGSGRLPRRDLAGVRPEGMAEIRRRFVNWARDQIRYNKGGFHV